MRSVCVAFVALLLALPVAALDPGIPGTTVALPQGPATLYVAAPGGTCADGPAAASVEPGTVAHLCVRWNASADDRTAQLVVAHGEAPGIAFNVANASSTVVAARTNETVLASLRFTVADGAAPGARTIAANLTVLLDGAPGAFADSSWTFAVAEPGPAPGSPWPLLVALAILIAVGGGGAIVLLRKRQVRGARRSQALRQMEAEQRLEKAKDPEAVAEIREEMRVEEEARALSREAQIVEAKIQDVRSGLDRLRERFEAGQLTRLQYDSMRAKREQNLEALERELEGLRTD